MSTPEFSAHEANHLDQLHGQERQTAIDGFREEECQLCDEVEAEWKNIPDEVRQRLTDESNCPAEFLSGTRQAFLEYVGLDASLAELTSSDLDDFMSLCLTEASEIAEKKEEIEEIDTTIDVLIKDIEAKAQGKKGRAYIAFAQRYVQEREMPDSVRENLQARFENIATTIDEMLAVTDDPDEQAAIAQIVDTSSLDLSGENRRAVFANVVEQIDASEDISKETKAKIKAEVIGVEGLDNATDTLNTLRDIRTNNGQFRNAHGKVVEFNDKNGVKIGRQTIFPDPKNPNGYLITEIVGGRKLTFPFEANTDPGYFNELKTSAAVAGIFANRDLQAPTQYILGHDGAAAQGYQEIRLDEEQVDRAKRLYGAFMGFGVELNTKFPSQSDLATFERRLQVTHPFGDLNTGDNTGLGDKGWTQIGMFKDGKLDIERIEEVGAFIRKNYNSLPSFEQLVEKFGEDAAFHQ